jgi:hypothetical protein
MQHSTVTLTDPTTHESHVYEGVTLEQLMPKTSLASEGETIEIEFDSHQTLIISRSELEPHTKPIIVDTVDGKQLSGHVPYYFVAKSRLKSLPTITEVQCITVKSSR